MAVIENETSDPARDDRATDEGRDRVMRLLQQAARTIDLMWRSAQTDGQHSAAVALGEASHGVHRALIALTEGAALT